MFEEKKNSIDEEKETARLRDVVLSWVDAKKTGAVASQKTTKKPISQKNPFKEEGGPSKSFGIFKLAAKILLITILLLVIFGVYIYTIKPINAFSSTITAVLPYPAIMVGNQFISYHEWQKQVSALMNFYSKEKQTNGKIDFPDSKQTKDHVTTRLIDKTILKQLARDYNITIQQQEISEKISTLVEKVGSEEILNQQLQELYGWTINDFQAEIIEPLILKEKVSVAMTLDDRINADSKKQAEEILEQVKVSPDQFSDLAIKYSQDVTAPFGGSIGYFGKGEMVPEFEDAVFNLQPGEISGLVKTQYGYHIILLEEYLYDDNNQLTQAKARHILIRTKDLQAYLEELRGSKRIWKLVN
jgi:parvulin-like peptidyl-prolyl isomerase